MAGKLRQVITKFFYSFSITNSISQSIRFTLSVKKLIKLSLPNTVFWIRNTKTDKDVFYNTFHHQYHRCPFYLGEKPIIVDLGSNIGLTIIDFKLQYQFARVLGAEMDEANFQIAMKNIENLDNCSVSHLAIWKSDEEVYYDGRDEQSFKIMSQKEGKKVNAVSISTFFRQKHIVYADYVKIDIEGAEYEVLCESEDCNWLTHVKYISIEIHEEHFFQPIIAKLEKQGFFVSRQSNHWSSLFAINKSFGYDF